jgi:uncharacterized delta-60 repeat protein
MRQLALTGLILTALLACGGGGGGGGGAASSSPGTMEGAWLGTIDYDGTPESGACLVLASGAMRMGTYGDIAANGTVSGSGTTFSGSGTAIFPAAPGGETFSVSGTVTAGQSFSGTYTTASGSGAFSFTSDAGANYDQPVNMALMAGNWQSTTNFTGQTITASLTAAGAISGQASGGAFTATLAAVDPNKNGFTVTGSYGGGSFNGLAFFDYSGTPTLYLQSSGSAGQFAGIFTQTQSANAAGTLDTTFGTGGTSVTSFNGIDDEAYAMAIQPADGKIILAGMTKTSTGAYQFALARYNADGSLDTGFGTGGKVTTAIGTKDDEVYALAVQPADGKIIAAGVTETSANAYQIALARYNANGSLDTTFGTGGKVTTAIGTLNDGVNALAIQPADGKIVAAGSTETSAHAYQFALVRYDANGSLDPAFGSSGVATTAIGTIDDTVYALALLSSGEILAAGYTQTTLNASDSFALARYSAAGALDSSFGTGGIVTTHLGSALDLAYAMVVQTDGKILLGGCKEAASADQFALVRYGTSGSVDTTFGTGGTATTTLGATDSWINSLALQSDQKIIAVGSMIGTSGSSMAVARFTAAGALDPSFGTGGVGKVSSSQGNLFGNCGALQSDGKIVVAGTLSVGATQPEFAVSRLWP